jgi:hypothetical protein
MLRLYRVLIFHESSRIAIDIKIRFDFSTKLSICSTIIRTLVLHVFSQITYITVLRTARVVSSVAS